MEVGVAVGKQGAVSVPGDPVVNFLFACDIESCVARIMVANAADATIIV